MHHVIHANDFTPDARATLPKPIQHLLEQEHVVIASVAQWGGLEQRPELTRTERLDEIHKLSA